MIDGEDRDRGSRVFDKDNMTVEKADVVGAVDWLAGRYGSLLPKSLADRAKETKVEVVGSSRFLELAESYLAGLGFKQIEETDSLDVEDERAKLVAISLGVDWAQVVSKRKAELEVMREKYVSNLGVSLCRDDGESEIYFNREKIDGKNVRELIAHEALHSMVNKADGSSGFRQEDGGYNGLNEATVALLVLSAKYPILDEVTLREKIASGEIKTPYRNRVSTLLTLMETTSSSDKPVTLNSLAKMYFDQDIPGNLKGIMFKMELARAIPEQLGGMKDFRDRSMAVFEEEMEGKGFKN